MSKRDLSPDSLEAQADALLAAADSMDIPDGNTVRFCFA